MTTASGDWWVRFAHEHWQVVDAKLCTLYNNINSRILLCTRATLRGSCGVAAWALKTPHSDPDCVHDWSNVKAATGFDQRQPQSIRISHGIKLSEEQYVQ